MPAVERVKIYNSQLLQELASDVHETHNLRKNKLKGKSRADSLAAAEAEKKALRFERFWQMQEKRLADSDRRVKEHVSKIASKKEEIFNALEQSMEENTQWVSHVDKMLELNELMKKQKSEEMYTKWKESVFDYIQSTICTELEGLDQKALSAKKNEVFQAFLDATNSKGALFLDGAGDGDYNPFALKEYNIKAKVGKLDDPTKRVVTKYMEERTMIDPSKGSEFKHGGRETLSVLMWGSGKIESTPHGHFAKAYGNTIDPKDIKSDYHSTLSAVNMDHFNIERGGDVVNSEFSKGRKTVQQMKEMAKALYLNENEVKAAGKVTDGGPSLASARGPVKVNNRPRKPQDPNPIC